MIKLDCESRFEVGEMFRRTASCSLLLLLTLSIFTLSFNAGTAFASSTYTRTYLPNEWISGGTAMGWYADDNCWPYTVPFDFPFYGTYYKTIYISSNGLITFSPDVGYSNSLYSLSSKLAIAPAWDDWITYSPNDIYVWQPDFAHVIVRWDVRHISSGAICNFETVLGVDGTIRFNYGENNGTVSATVGISDGGTEVLATDMVDLNYVRSVVFSPFRPEHELAVFQEAPDSILPGDTIVLNATVLNLGVQNETNVVLELIINGTVVNSATVLELLTGAYYAISHLWTPGEGLYNVTSFSPSVFGEDDASNNVVTQFVEVTPPKITPAEGQWADYEMSLFDQGSGQIMTTAWLGFGYDRYVSPYEINVTVRSSSYQQNTSGWIIVNTLNRLVESDSGIGWTGMGFPGMIETDISVGSTLNLLGATAIVIGSEVLFALEHSVYPIDCWKLTTIMYGYEYNFWFDKATGIWVGMEYIMSPYRGELSLSSTNIPLVMYEHELAVTLDAPSIVSLDATIVLTATAYNLGSSDETNVQLLLLINGALVDSVQVPVLSAGSSYTLTYPWVPTVDIEYNITAYCLPVLNESILQNNVATAIRSLPSTHSLVVLSSIGGTTDPAPGTYSYTQSSLVQVTAFPDSQYLFDHWELDGVNVGWANPITVQMDTSHTIVPLFVQVLPPSMMISIFSDGTIYPADAPIIITDNATYTLTENINGVIFVYRDNIVIDGNGHTLQGTGIGNARGDGIDLFDRENVTIRNFKLANFESAIYLLYSSNNVIQANTITGCTSGIYIDAYAEPSSNNTITGNVIESNDVGILLRYSSDGNNIDQNELSNNNYGIKLDTANNNNVSRNNITVNNYRGIWIGYSSNTTIDGNNVSNNNYGIYVSFHSDGNLIYANNLTANNCGIWFSSSTSLNRVFHNNFVNNANQAYSADSGNSWNDGYPSGGNYWSDYAGPDDMKGRNQDQPGSDGIGDYPYAVDPVTLDDYPLMRQFSLISAPAWDINQDGYCNAKDVVALGRHFGAQSGTPDYLLAADLNADGYIDARDAVVIGSHFGEAWQG